MYSPMSGDPRDRNKQICDRRLRGWRSRQGISCTGRATRSPAMRIDLLVIQSIRSAQKYDKFYSVHLNCDKESRDKAAG